MRGAIWACQCPTFRIYDQYDRTTLHSSAPLTVSEKHHIFDVALENKGGSRSIRFIDQKLSIHSAAVSLVASTLDGDRHDLLQPRHQDD
jgi:hypothetical protein